MGIHRTAAARKRRAEAAATKAVNSVRKTSERARRDARMLETIKSGSLPYTPDVMSWLSSQLNKKSSRITAEDVARLVS